MSGIRLRPIHTFFFLAEMTLMLVASLIALFLRFQLSAWDVFSYPNLLPKIMFVVWMTQLCLYYNGLYELGRGEPVHSLVLRVFQGVGASIIILLATYYLFPSLLIGRGAFLFMMIGNSSAVLLLRGFFQVLSKQGHLAKRVLVVGSGSAAVEIIRYVSDPNRFAYELVGFLDEDHAVLGPFSAAAKKLGGYIDLFRVSLRENVDLIVVALDERRGRLPLSELSECKLRGVEVIEGSQFWEVEQGMISLQDLRPSWLVFSDGFRQSRVTILLKSVGEFFVASIVMVLASPLFLLTALAIKLDSKGPVLFRQVRVGARGRLFTLYKFRSMRIDAEADGKAIWAQEEDPRVTRIGKLVRKYRLDELPQLVNIIRGEMSLVGPRPERPQFVEELTDKIPCYFQRHAVKPGLTGLAQVRHRYGASIEDSKRKLEYDLYYVKHLSIFLDFSILVDTVKVVVLGSGAR